MHEYPSVKSLLLVKNAGNRHIKITPKSLIFTTTFIKKQKQKIEPKKKKSNQCPTRDETVYGERLF